MKIKEKSQVARWSGATQSDRLLRALLPTFVKVDERNTSDMLAIAAEYSKLISYYGPDNSKLDNYDWSKFFTNDISVFISSIITTNLREIERHHINLLHSLENAPRTDEKLEALEGLVSQQMNMYKRINDWYVHTLQMTRLNPTDSTDLENELENAIQQQLSKNMHLLLDYRKDLNFSDRGEFPQDALEDVFHSIWFKNPLTLLDTPQTSPEAIAKLRTDEKIRAYTKQLRIQFRTAYSVTAYIVQNSPKFLYKTLHEKDDHRPDMSLFIAFVELYKHAQDQLNTITEKHLDFYYYDVLKLKERSYTPDQVNVFFQIAEHIDSHVIPRGTLLSAGTNENNEEVFYATDNDIEINKAKIEELKTVFVSKNPKVGIGSSYRLISNIYAAPVANSKDGLGERFINDFENWPTFGEELLDKIETERQMTFGDVGFALSAPVLHMEEGHRIASLKLEFDKTSMYTLNLLVKDISKNREISREDAFSRVFRNSLRAHVTTLKGWTAATSCEVLPPSNWEIPEITIIVTFAAAAPSIVNYDVELHGHGYECTAPVLRILHQNINAAFSYSFFKELILQKCTIDVTAKGLRNLSLSSDFGPLDSSLPFQPFGPIPRLGSYMLIGKAEMFKKELTDLNVNIEWHIIPDSNKGFRGHYREYNLGLNNDSFKVQISALSDGIFYPKKDDLPVEFSLFEDDKHYPTQTSRTTTWSNIDIKSFNLQPDPELVLPDAFNNEVRTGYFKVELSSPKVAFAHDQYPNIYTHVITNNSNLKKKEDLAIPNQPFTPMVKTITIDYSATAQVNIVSIGTVNKGELVDEQLYHIHPYGVIRTFHKGKSSNRYLVPSYNEDAYLYLGLRDLTPPCPLSLYFELRDNPNNLDLFETSGSKPEIVWSYLVNDEWKDFSQTQILTDTTNSFNNSGIISMDIPRDLTKKNHILNGELHWIRVSVKGDAAKLPRTLKVASQAVSATWHNYNESEGAQLAKPLAAKTISSMVNIISEVREVGQPFKSFGGRATETKREFYTRVSERLRHKNRAVSAWDYERLVLEAFPDIFQAKCVTHLGNENFVDKGSVVMVVVPRIDPDNLMGMPRVNYSILQNIREYLQAHASPFVNIEVRNPIYERVKVTAGLRFTKDKNNGTYLKKLNHEILEFMCPWLKGQDRELDLGGILSKDMILSFIEKRSYVEFVTKFSAVQLFFDENAKMTGFDIDDTAIDVSSSPIIKASKPWSVLIPFETNPLYLLEDTNFQAPEKSSIDSMILDSGDFVITVEKPMDSHSRDRDQRKK